jgi:hypothetical protein
MIYRPQFAYPTPEGFRDQEFEHYYDSTVLPALNPTTAFPATLFDIPLTIDPDAKFMWRGVKFDHATISNFGVRFRDTRLNYLSDDFVPVWLAFIPPSLTALSGGQGVTHEPEVICPKAGVVMIDIKSYDTVPWTTGGPQNVTLCGVKRYSLADCGCDGQ